MQAAINVLMGERYKNVSNEVKAYFRGEYGKAPGELNQELVNNVLGDETPLLYDLLIPLSLCSKKLRKNSAAWLILMKMCFPI